MQFISKIQEDGPQIPSGDTGYEWWYFDAFDDRSETTFVAIFYMGNPFSRRMFNRRTGMFADAATQFPAISISLHRKGKPLFVGFREFKPEESGVSDKVFRAGNSYVEVEEKFWSLQLDFDLPGGLTLRGKVRFDKDRDGWFDLRNPNEAHSWNLTSAKSGASGTLVVLKNGMVKERIEIRGEGYHDHNWGTRPLHRDFVSWSWSRIHLPEATVVFYDKVLSTGVTEFYGWICRDASESAESITVKRESPKTALFGFSSPRQFQLEGKGFRATVRHEKVLETGPFYQRFLSGSHYVLDGKSGFVQGISEFIKPKNIHARLFRPLAEMRITYPDRKPHWVQRFTFLYKRTWL